MKYINKANEPEVFSNWKNRNINCNWNDFSRLDSEHREIYLELRKELIEQQEKMCCYCEVALEEERDAHIEHLKDRHNYPNSNYDFDNLLASCQNNDSCGHKKGPRYFTGMITPLIEDCQDKFTYTRDGNIISVDENDNSVQETINLLNLNCKRLKDRRKNLIKILETVESEYLYLSLNSCVEWYQGYYTVIKYMINNQ